VNSDPDTDLIQDFDDQKLKKKKIPMKNLFLQKLHFTHVHASEDFSPQKRKHPELQKMESINFFLCLWVIFALLDPDPDPQLC
jgi:hypothetical protein